MLKRGLLIALILVAILSSCGQKGSSRDIKAKLSAIKSYEAEIEITVYGDSSNTQYTAKQYCVYPDKLRLEIEKPSFLMGQVILYNSGKLTIYHPSIDMETTVDGVKEEQDYINAGFLLKSIGEVKKSDYIYRTVDGIEYLVIKASVPRGNSYRTHAEVYFERLGGTPAFMNIMDSDGRLRTHIKYIKFRYNPVIKEDMFTTVRK